MEEYLQIKIGNPHGHSEEKSIEKIERAIHTLKTGKNGCEVHHILSELGVLVSLGHGRGCCATLRNIKEIPN